MSENRNSEVQTHSAFRVFCVSVFSWLSFPWLFLIFDFAISEVVRFNPPRQFEFELKGTYNDNIFLYSPTDIKQFLRQENPQKFPFATYDDFVLSTTARLKIKSKTVSINAGLKQNQYTMNRLKSYQVLSLNSILRPKRIYRWQIELATRFIPKYLLRFYKNPLNKSEYIACEFRETLFSLSLDYRFLSFRVNPFYKFVVDNYIASFDFYDTKAHRFGVGLNYRHKKFELRTELEARKAKAKGDLPDISYTQKGLEIETRIKPEKPLPLIFIVGYTIAKRDFTTKNPLDLFHIGRSDFIDELRFALPFPITKRLQIEPEMRIEIREVSSPYKEDIDEIKNYRKKGLSISIFISY